MSSSQSCIGGMFSCLWSSSLEPHPFQLPRVITHPQYIGLPGFSVIWPKFWVMRHSTDPKDNTESMQLSAPHPSHGLLGLSLMPSALSALQLGNCMNHMLLRTVSIWSFRPKITDFPPLLLVAFGYVWVCSMITLPLFGDFFNCESGEDDIAANKK